MSGDWSRGFPSQEQLEKLAALKQMWGGPHGPGFRGSPFAGPFGGGPFGGGRGRKRRGDVRVALLLLLAEEPRNGYQLMQTIEERSGGRWRPSPGSVYPTLAQLEDEGLIRATDREGSKLFALTDAGRERAERSTGAAPWEVADDPIAHSFSELSSLVVQIGKAAWQVSQVGDERQTGQACEVLAEARRALYRILAEEQDA
ncbi:MAG: PadR family transcriptional regulator [Actinomycetota bacterium]|nr:PadR family transcriptional regulator [Actinomycetota bacterium]